MLGSPGSNRDGGSTSQIDLREVHRHLLTTRIKDYRSAKIKRLRAGLIVTTEWRVVFRPRSEYSRIQSTARLWVSRHHALRRLLLECHAIAAVILSVGVASAIGRSRRLFGSGLTAIIARHQFDYLRSRKINGTTDPEVLSSQAEADLRLAVPGSRAEARQSGHQTAQPHLCGAVRRPSLGAKPAHRRGLFLAIGSLAFASSPAICWALAGRRGFSPSSFSC